MLGPGLDPTLVLINPLRGGAFGAAIVAGLLLLQWAHRRRSFILAWAGGWLLLTPAMLLVSHEYATPLAGRAATGASQLLAIGSAATFLWSGDLLRGTRYVQLERLKPASVIVLWFLLAPLLLGVRAVLVPGAIVTAALLAAAGSMYAAVLVERRMIGAGLVSFVLLGLAIASVTTAFSPPRAGQSPFAFEMLLIGTVLYAAGALGVHLLVFEDMTYELRVTNRRLQAAREQLLQAAITDPLTGCHNRRFLDQVIRRELQRHDRFNLPLSLLFIDVDRFKQINDTLGHEAGDRVLQYVAGFLRRHIREADFIFRWGGDEFLVLITCTGDEARRKAAALQASFAVAPETVELPPGVGLSVGWTEVRDTTTDIATLVAEADRRMYQDKSARR